MDGKGRSGMSGTDWNRNGRVDSGDRYMDYEIMNDKGGGGGQNGCGCIVLASGSFFTVALILRLFS